MGRSPCCAKEGLNRGAWTAQEDQILTDYIKAHGEGRWRNLPRKAGLKRCGKSCRLRWLNYLRPDIKRGNISPDEDELIIRLHKLLGNRWSLIAGRLPGRTDNEIKNYWNTNLSKKVESRPNVAPVLCSRERPNHHRASEHKPMISSESKVIPVNNSTQSPLDSHVIKTKALKCSEQVLINPPEQQQQHHQELFHQNKDHVTTVWDATLQLDPNLTPAATLVPHAFGSGEDDDILAEDLLVEDFDIGEICLSELLGSDLSAGGTQELKSRNTTSLDVDHHHQLFTENNITEVQEEDEGWRVMMRDCCVGTPSFASILDCSRGDQWI